MLPRNHPDRIGVSFDDAWWPMPGSPSGHPRPSPGLRRPSLDLGVAPGRANTGDKMDCIDDADALRAGGTARILGGTIKAPGHLPAQFSLGPRVSRELLARAWQASAGPGDS